VALVCGGRLFHACTAATGNARSWRVDRWVDATSLWVSQHGADGDEQQRLMSAAGCQPDTPVRRMNYLCSPLNSVWLSSSLIVVHDFQCVSVRVRKKAEVKCVRYKGSWQWY